MPQNRKKKNSRPRLGEVRVRAVHRPEPDWDKYAWAVLQLAKAESEAARRRQDGEQ